jgi:hypothetical protein
MLKFYLCAQNSPDDAVEIIETFDSIDAAIASMDAILSMTDCHVWIGQVPSRVQHYECEPILY